MFGSETWGVTEMGMLGTGIHGPVVEQGLWRIITKQELVELHKDPDILADIKKERLEWVEHVVRMN